MEAPGGLEVTLQRDGAGLITSGLAGGAGSATFAHDSHGRPRQTDYIVHGYDWAGRRVRSWDTSKPSSDAILLPVPGYSYEAGRVNKHFFLAGRRIAAGAQTWTAPEADAPVGLLPRLPAPPPWAWGLAYVASLGGLLVLAARRRPGALASRRLRLASVGVLSTVGPTLLLGCPPQGKPFGTFGEAALFFVTDAIGSTILAIRPNGTVRNRYLYRPFGGMAVEEGHDLEHGFAGGARLAGTALYALGPRLYHADTGHFYEPDPWLGDPAQPRTLQSYGYALGNPLSYSDPSGMQPVCDFPGGCGPSLPPPIIFDPFRPIPYPPAPRWQHPPENRATNVPRAPDARTGEGDLLYATVLVLGQERIPEELVDRLDEAAQIELAKLRLRIAEIEGVNPDLVALREIELRDIGVNLGIGPMKAITQALGLGVAVTPGKAKDVVKSVLGALTFEVGPPSKISSAAGQVAAWNRQLGLAKLKRFVMEPIR